MLTPRSLPAQMHHVEAPDKVTRAVGVYEWTGELAKPSAARFVPVSLFINGRLEDAGLYLARPVPFALQSGDVYAVEHAGEPQGLLDLQYAQRVVTRQAMADDDPEGAWYAYGKFTPEAPPKLPPALHASAHLPVILADGKAEPAPAETGKPHLSRRDDAGTGAATPADTNPDGSKGASGAKGSSDGGSSSGASRGGSGASDDDTDRPTLRRRDPSQDAARRRDYGKSSKQASVSAVGPDPADDPDRPVLGRNDTDDKGTPPLTGLPADLHQAVAVSDPVHRDSHEFARDWESPAERATTLAALAEQARQRVAAYLGDNRLVASRGPLPAEAAAATATATAPTTATAAANDASDEDASHPTLRRGVPRQYANAGTGTPAAPTTPGSNGSPAAPPPPAPVATKAPASSRSARRPQAHPIGATPAKVPLSLERQQVQGFNLSYGGLPTFVYSAAVPVAAISSATPAGHSAVGSRAPSTPPPASSPLAVYVTVVAQRLPTGELQVALSSVTDSHHLDRAPRLRLVDAVDPDNSHRASLLFELRGASSRQFGLYRLTAVQAEPILTTASIE